MTKTGEGVLERTAHMPVSIHLSQVSKHYGRKEHAKWALRDVSLTIEPGVFGLLGRNGAGKTTLLQILATLLEPSGGDFKIGPFDGRRNRRNIRAQLGFLPQEQGFYPQLTVRETMRYMAALQRLDHANRYIERALEAVNLSDRAGWRVGKLSGGMRRRLGLAQALLGDRPVLIIDEPTAGLDPVEQQRFRALLGTLGAQGERTIILSTHIIDDVATVARRLAVLEHGELVFTGGVSELAARAEGRCWRWRTTLDVLERVRAEHNRHALLVTSLTPVTEAGGIAGEVIAHIVGERPDPSAVAVEPRLEDGYFLAIGATE